MKKKTPDFVAKFLLFFSTSRPPLKKQYYFRTFRKFRTCRHPDIRVSNFFHFEKPWWNPGFFCGETLKFLQQRVRKQNSRINSSIKKKKIRSNDRPFSNPDFMIDFSSNPDRIGKIGKILILDTLNLLILRTVPCYTKNTIDKSSKQNLQVKSIYSLQVRGCLLMAREGRIFAHPHSWIY